MAIVTTVVTPARFAQGLSYAGFIEKATVNRDKFDESYQSAPLTDGDLSFFRKAAALPNGPAKILAIAEPWCGDVYRELPTLARIAEATGMDLRVFYRDENPDVMDEFLSNGKARAIPVFVFYTADLQYIARFNERSASASPTSSPGRSCAPEAPCNCADSVSGGRFRTKATKGGAARNTIGRASIK